MEGSGPIRVKYFHGTATFDRQPWQIFASLHGGAGVCGTRRQGTSMDPKMMWSVSRRKCDFGAEGAPKIFLGAHGEG